MTKIVTPDHPADDLGHSTLVAAARSALDAFMALDLCQVNEPPPRTAG